MPAEVQPAADGAQVSGRAVPGVEEEGEVAVGAEGAGF